MVISLSNETMRNRQLICSTFLLLMSGAVRAQQPTITPERQAAVMNASRLMNVPAEFVLRYRKELSLSTAQVASFEKLSMALKDSAAARSLVRARALQSRKPSPAFMSAMQWTGPIDEVAIREYVRERSGAEADALIATARDRRAVGALLTEAQRAQLPQLQQSEMMKAMRGGSR